MNVSSSLGTSVLLPLAGPPQDRTSTRRSRGGTSGHGAGRALVCPTVRGSPPAWVEPRPARP